MPAPPNRNPLAGAWPGSRVLLIAGGPSLTREQIEAARPAAAAGTLRVVGVNDAYRLCDFLHVLYAADWTWWRVHAPRAPLGPLWVTVAETVDLIERRPRPIGVPGVHSDRLSDDPHLIAYGQHSGFQALALAVAAGASELLLLGYDYRQAEDGRDHWFGDHPTECRHGGGPDTRARVLERFREAVDGIADQLQARGVRVINCSPGSALKAYPRMDIAEALA